MLRRIICIAGLLCVIMHFAKGQGTSYQGGFGSLAFQYTQLADQRAFEAGGIGAGYFTNQTYLGGGGFGVSSSINGTNYSLGYGGVIAGVNNSANDKRIGWNTYVLIGYGGASVKQEIGEKLGDDVWVLKPTIEVEIKVLEWMRFGIGGGYRLVTGSDIYSFDNKDMSAPFASVSLRMGVF